MRSHVRAGLWIMWPIAWLWSWQHWCYNTHCPFHRDFIDVNWTELCAYGLLANTLMSGYTCKTAGQYHRFGRKQHVIETLQYHMLNRGAHSSNGHYMLWGFLAFHEWMLRTGDWKGSDLSRIIDYHASTFGMSGLSTCLSGAHYNSPVPEASLTPSHCHHIFLGMTSPPRPVFNEANSE